MLKYWLALSLTFAAHGASAADWQFNKKDNYAMQVSGDNYFMLICYPMGISMEYANSKEMQCSEETFKCNATVDYDDHGKQQITLTMDAGAMMLNETGKGKTTVPLGFIELATYKGADDDAELGAFANTKKLELAFPAISRTVTFDAIGNGKELVSFFQSCKSEAEAYEKTLEEQRKKLKEQEQEKKP